MVFQPRPFFIPVGKSGDFDLGWKNCNKISGPEGQNSYLNLWRHIIKLIAASGIQYNTIQYEPKLSSLPNTYIDSAANKYFLSDLSEELEKTKKGSKRFATFIRRVFLSTFIFFIRSPNPGAIVFQFLYLL